MKTPHSPGLALNGLFSIKCWYVKNFLQRQVLFLLFKVADVDQIWRIAVTTSIRCLARSLGDQRAYIVLSPDL